MYTISAMWPYNYTLSHNNRSQPEENRLYLFLHTSDAGVACNWNVVHAASQYGYVTSFVSVSSEYMNVCDQECMMFIAEASRA